MWSDGQLNAASIQVDEILSTLEYRAVWWRFFHAPSASEWANALVLIQLLFSLPASNGRECFLSTIALILTLPLTYGGTIKCVGLIRK